MRSIQVFGNKSYYWLDATKTTTSDTQCTDTITLIIYAGYHYLIPDASALMGETDVNTPMSDIDSTSPTTRDLLFMCLLNVNVIASSSITQRQSQKYHYYKCKIDYNTFFTSVVPTLFTSITIILLFKFEHVFTLSS